MAEISDIRRHLKQRIDQARRDATVRRGLVEQAETDYQRFLTGTAIPTFSKFAIVLKAEGYPFSLLTPERTVRLVPEGHGQDFIELELDSSRTPPVVVGRSRFALGRRVTAIEQPLREGVAVGDLTEDDVTAFVLEALGPFLER